MIVLACTHYPFLIERMKQVAPWPVEWVDPAPAIARRVLAVMGADGGGSRPRTRERLAELGETLAGKASPGACGDRSGTRRKHLAKLANG